MSEKFNTNTRCQIEKAIQDFARENGKKIEGSDQIISALENIYAINSRENAGTKNKLLHKDAVYFTMYNMLADIVNAFE